MNQVSDGNQFVHVGLRTDGPHLGRTMRSEVRDELDSVVHEVAVCCQQVVIIHVLWVIY